MSRARPETSKIHESSTSDPCGTSRRERTSKAWPRLADPTRDFSFPSDHAVMAGAVAAGLLLVSRRLGLLAVVAALVMAFARVYIAAHYPWDVIAGLGLGAAVVVLGWVLLGRRLLALTGWLRSRPGVREVFGPEPSREQQDVIVAG